MGSSSLYDLPSKLIRQRSRGVLFSTPPPLPLIALSPDDEWEEFDTPTQTGFGYTLPCVATLDAPEAHEHAAQGSVVVTPEAARCCRLLSEYMTNNEFFQTPRHGFGLETRLVYKRNKERESNSFASTADQRHLEDLGFGATFESGNLDRAYRVLGRRYAPSHDLLMLRGPPSSSTLRESARPITAAPASSTSTISPPQSSVLPFSFFTEVDSEYDLYADTDVNTQGHIQWYFFRVTLPSMLLQQTRERGADSVKVRFNIRNMMKKASLYNDGMLPAVYNESLSTTKRGWHHAGTNVCYFKNAETYRHRRTGKVQNYYTLSFVYEFPLVSLSTPAGGGSNRAPASPGHERKPIVSSLKDEPVVAYFAHSYPYTYTRLQRFVLGMQKDPERSRTLKRRVLCKTIAGNNCDLLTITDFAQEDEQNPSMTAASRRRTAIVITARVHPGESNSSFVMHGILDFLTGNSLEARFLRHYFVFKVVPMLNPDGVIHGNYRCSLAGADLNRRWLNPSSELHPTIFATKNMIRSVRQTRPVSLYCDLHGHSRKKNIFLYGCRPFLSGSRSEAARLRLFPHILCKTSDCTRGGFYSFGDCTFSISASKKGTGRVVVWNELHVLHSFTLEASFFGVDPAVKKPQPQQQGVASRLERNLIEQPPAPLRHFTPTDLHTAGLKFCHALLPFSQVLDLQPANGTCALSVTPPPLDPKVAGSPADSLAISAGTSSGQREPDTDESSRSSNVAAAATDTAADNKIRLTPLQPRQELPALSQELERVPSWTAPPRLTSTRLDSVPIYPSDSIDSSSSPFVCSMPPEFDQLFAGEDMSSMFSMLEHDDLIKEIEASLPDNLQDNPEENASVGSESDPSGDNMEEEEEEAQQKAAPPKKVVLPPPQKADAIVVSHILLVRSKPPRVLRHRSEPRLPQPVEQKQLPEHKVVTLEPVTVRSRAIRMVTPKQTPAVELASRTKAPLVQRTLISRNLPPDRNQDIAAMHLHAVQRRSKSRHSVRQTLLETDAS